MKIHMAFFMLAFSVAGLMASAAPVETLTCDITTTSKSGSTTETVSAVVTSDPGGAESAKVIAPISKERAFYSKSVASGLTTLTFGSKIHAVRSGYLGHQTLAYGKEATDITTTYDKAAEVTKEVKTHCVVKL
jgi:hypothetical protein